MKLLIEDAGWDIDHSRLYYLWKYRQLLYARITGFKNSLYLPTTVRKLPHRKLCPSGRQKQGFGESPFQGSLTVTCLTHYPWTLLTVCAAAGPSFPQQRKNKCAGAQELRSRAVLWPPHSTKRKQELAQPWLCLGRGLPWAPSKSQAGAPRRNPQQEAQQLRQKSTQAARIYGGRGGVVKSG